MKNGQIKIGDLGSARFMNNNSNVTNRMDGNIKYMSPELLINKSNTENDLIICKKTDIWY